MFASNPCLPLQGEPQSHTRSPSHCKNGLSSLTITARSPKACIQRRVWVDFPVPLWAVNR